jgi:Skp family chaperone for outer membrane proteins
MRQRGAADPGQKISIQKSGSNAMTGQKLTVLAVLIVLAASGCTQHKVEVAPVEVKPIHITIDVNVKVDRALDDFFNDIDKAAQKIEPQAPATQ